MPKKTGLNSGLAHRLEDEAFLRPVLQNLSLEERGELRRFFDSTAWKKTIANARTMRPNEFPQGCETALGLQIGNNRLHILQGWKLCEIAIASQVEAPAVRAPVVKDSYPPGGQIDHAIPLPATLKT